MRGTRWTKTNQCQRAGQGDKEEGQSERGAGKREKGRRARTRREQRRPTNPPPHALTPWKVIRGNRAYAHRRACARAHIIVVRSSLHFGLTSNCKYTRGTKARITSSPSRFVRCVMSSIVARSNSNDVCTVEDIMKAVPTAVCPPGKIRFESVSRLGESRFKRWAICIRFFISLFIIFFFFYVYASIKYEINLREHGL